MERTGNAIVEVRRIDVMNESGREHLCQRQDRDGHAGGRQDGDCLRPQRLVRLPLLRLVTPVETFTGNHLVNGQDDLPARRRFMKLRIGS